MFPLGIPADRSNAKEAPFEEVIQGTANDLPVGGVISHMPVSGELRIQFSDHATIGPSELWNGGTDHLRYLAQLPQYRFNLEKMIDVVASVNSFPSTTIK